MSNNKYKVLICEDDTSIADVVATVLDSNGYQTQKAYSCQEAIMQYGAFLPDLVILDLGLPDTDGTEFIRKTRLSSSLPILVLSARSEEKDKVRALEMGANDYITKPFGTAELVARVRAALRTVNTLTANSPQSKFQLKDMVIDYDRRLVTVNGADIRLTQTEYNILSLLARNTGKVMTYSEIIGVIWGKADFNAVKKLQVNMANLRKKLGTRPGDWRYIINELGVGYRIQDGE